MFNMNKVMNVTAHHYVSFWYSLTLILSCDSAPLTFSIRRSSSSSSFRCVRIISGPSVAIVNSTPCSTNARNVSRTADSSGSAFVNIARGQVVDEAALIANLRSNHIGFAALDVATVEPLAATSPLWDLPNVLISPHSASTVASENAKITEIFCHNLAAYLDGRLDDMKNVLNKELMY